MNRAKNLIVLNNSTLNNMTLRAYKLSTIYIVKFAD